MSSLGDLYTHLKTLCEQWFYNKSTIDGYLNNKISKSSTVGLVKNDGSIDTKSYVTSSSLPSKTSDLTNDGSDGSHPFIDSSDSRLTNARTPTSHSHGNLQNTGQVGSTVQANKNVVTDSNGRITTEDKPTIPTKTSDLFNDGYDGDSAFATQSGVDSAIEIAIGNLTGLQAYEITSDKGTASESTMGKLYIEVGTETTDVYYTVEDNGIYSWESLDTDILDNLSIDWDDVANKPSLFSGSYNDLSDKPSSFTPSSHTHGNITNDGLITGSTYAHRTLVKPLGYYTNSNNEIVKCSSLSAYTILDSNAHSNIGSSANATQETINSSIDTALGGKVSSSDLGSVAFSNSYDDLDDLPTLFSGDYDDLINKPNIPSGVVVDTTLNSSSNNAIANSTVTTALNGKVDTNDSRLTDARTPTSHTHGYVQNGGTLTQTGTNNGSIVVTNSSNKIVIQSSIDVLDGLVQDLITYGSS